VLSYKTYNLYKPHFLESLIPGLYNWSLSPVPEATQVLGTRGSGSAPSGSQAKSSGAVNSQQAARQPDEAMSSGAGGWAGSQPRRCAGRPAGAHRRGEDEPRNEVNGFPTPLEDNALRGSKVPLQERLNGPLKRLELCLTTSKNEICAKQKSSIAAKHKLCGQDQRVIPGWIFP
jgi:hypothetical protein